MKQQLGKFALFTLFIYLITGSCIGFQKIAWGTGELFGGTTLKWGLAFALYIVFCITLVLLSIVVLWRGSALQPGLEKLSAFRGRLGRVRWLPALLIFILPVWFFQYTAWGFVFSDIYIRLLAWCLIVPVLAFFITEGGGTLFGWNEFLAALLLTSGEFVIAVSFINVSSHPFSLTWSEGNRIWDYSILFGRHLYDYPAGQEIHVLLDIGRQFVGGLPFLIPGLTIGMERFWIGLMTVIPYFLLGLAAFRSVRADRKVWLLLALWALIFLRQGPIHPPLVLCAVAVALLWESPLWLALPLIALTGYAAEESRFTWLFAPGLWIGMLEFSGAALQNKKLSPIAWVRAAAFGLTGMSGGYFGTKLAGLLAGDSGAAVAISSGGIATKIADQPLLWYRLLPNATYGIGVLAGLAAVVLPLILVLAYLISVKKWPLNVWQAAALSAPLLAFLGVGLIASTKIGGGGDLHNLDMFLIGLMFGGVIAWRNGGADWLANIGSSPAWVKLSMVLLLALPGLQPLTTMRSFNFAAEASWLSTLTDTPLKLISDMMIPSPEAADNALKTIRTEVSEARSLGGEVLFLDQRQLLTFGYVRDVPLIPEYEKKLLMDRALSSNAGYFESFYTDLAARRFALIISEELFAPIKDSSFQFGEENNAWVKWVSKPVLCYYEVKRTLKNVDVQLLVPREGTLDCAGKLPK